MKAFVGTASVLAALVAAAAFAVTAPAARAGTTPPAPQASGDPAPIDSCGLANFVCFYDMPGLSA